MHIISFKDPLITALNLWINGGSLPDMILLYTSQVFYIVETLEYIGQAKNFWAWSTSTCWIIPLSFKWDYCHYPALLLFSRINSKKRCTIISRISAIFFERDLMVSWNLSKFNIIFTLSRIFSPILSPLCIICQCTHPHCSSHLWKPLCSLLLMLLVFLGLVKASACRFLCIVLSLFLSLKVLQIYSLLGIHIYTYL